MAGGIVKTVSFPKSLKMALLPKETISPLHQSKNSGSEYILTFYLLLLVSMESKAGFPTQMEALYHLISLITILS